MRQYVSISTRRPRGGSRLNLGLGHVIATNGDERITIGHKFFLLQSPYQYGVFFGRVKEFKDVIGIRENLPALKAWKQNKDSIFWFSKVGVRLNKENKRVTFYVPNRYHLWIDRNTVF